MTHRGCYQTVKDLPIVEQSNKDGTVAGDIHEDCYWWYLNVGLEDVTIINGHSSIEFECSD